LLRSQGASPSWPGSWAYRSTQCPTRHGDLSVPLKPEFGFWCSVDDECKWKASTWPILTARFGARWQIFLVAGGVVVRVAKRSYATWEAAERELGPAIARAVVFQHRSRAGSDLDKLVRAAGRSRAA
jgi:hypothetical protein